MRWIATLAATALMASAALAAPITYNGTLVSAVTETGSVPPVGNLTGDPSTWSYWQFYATAGDTVSFDVNRLDAEFDPVAGVFEGVYADSDDLLAFLDIYGGLAFGDDEDAPNVAGPFGDPNFVFNVMDSGWYTFAVASGVSGIDPFATQFNYEVSMDGANGVPEPGMIGLLGLGLAGVVVAKRRRRV